MLDVTSCILFMQIILSFYYVHIDQSPAKEFLLTLQGRL